MSNNFVGERLQTIKANQGDVRVDWSASNNDKIFGRFSIAEYEDVTDKRAFPLLLGSSQDAPFRNLAFNWNRIFKSSLVNELLVGYNQIGIVNHTLDWAGIGNGNQTFGIAGGQPIDGLSSIGLGSGLTGLGAGASDSDTLDKHYQINEKLTWLKGRHSMKFGGQLIHYVQRRFYAGNNGLLGIFGYSVSVHRIRVLRLPARPGGQQGSRQPVRGVDAPAQSRVALCSGRLQAPAGPDAQPRDALGVHAADRREGQSSVELRPENRRADLPGRQQPRGARALPGVQEGLRAATRLRLAGSRSLGGQRRLRHLAVHGRDRRQPSAAAESAVLLRIGRELRRRRAARALSTTGFAELRPLDQPSGQVRAWDPNLRPQFTQQWNVFAEYLVTDSMSANVGYVGHDADHLVTPVEGNQPLPGTGDVSTWLPTQQRRPLFATAPLITNISTTAARGRSDYKALQASLRQRNVSRVRVPRVVHAERDEDEQPWLLRLGRRRRLRARTG